MWELQVYPDSRYIDDFKALDDLNKNSLDDLLDELMLMDDPEDHPCAIDCVNVPYANHAIKLQCEKIILIISLDRIMENTDFEVDIINLYSCSQF